MYAELNVVVFVVDDDDDDDDVNYLLAYDFKQN
jgi:hypothetical protein